MIKRSFFNLSLVVFSILVFSPVTVSAIGDDFLINATVTGSDTTPPSTPTNLSFVSVGEEEISISWDASTDNVSVSGYQVYRDATQIATTTLTSYTDTGLSASTSYSYFVRAFDPSYNYSSSSNVISTTTASTTPVEDDDQGEDGDSNSNRVAMNLKDINVSTSETLASIDWSVNRRATFMLRWGRTTSYEIGYVATAVAKSQHETEISGLEPGTTYEYELLAYDQDGDEYVLKRDTFTTKGDSGSGIIANVSNLSAEVVTEGVYLAWQNPSTDNFSYVRVVRSHLFFPLSPNDGFIVYEGSAESILDVNPFSLSTVEYYTVFSYDNKGNISSGAVVWVNKATGQISITEISITPPDSSDESTTTREYLEAITGLTIDQVQFIQNDKLIKMDKAGFYKIDGNRDMTVRIPYQHLPEHLKTITVSLEHPEDPNKIFTFLLKVNKDKTAYEATVAPLKVGGFINTKVHIFDFKADAAHVVTLDLSSRYKPVTENYPIFRFIIDNLGQIVFISLLLLLIFLYGLYLIHKSYADA